MVVPARLTRPCSVEQVSFVDNISGVLDEGSQHREGTVPEIDRSVTASQRPPVKIDPELTEGDQPILVHPPGLSASVSWVVLLDESAVLLVTMGESVEVVMRRDLLVLFALCLVAAGGSIAAEAPPSDVIPVDGGEVVLSFLGHGTLMLEHGGKVVHIDPWSRQADYKNLPDADLVLITHHHRDHLDPAAIAEIRGAETVVIGSPEVCAAVDGCRTLRNGESTEAIGIQIRAVPAYNLVHRRDNGEPFHPKGRDNGYIVEVAGKTIYFAGDTENTPEMKALTGIDIAFLPMNLPYTMTPEMVADAARAFRPRILYPYHYGDTDPDELAKLLANEKDIEVRIRPLR